jgi:hypothetical protein
MLMLRRGIKNTMTWFLLVYFGIFIVPPVSSFGRADASMREQQSFSRAQRPAFLFDIILWQKLKQTRHSRFPAPPPDGSIAHDDSTGCPDGQAAVQFKIAFPGQLDNSGRSLPESCQSRSSDIRFSRSGISPPFFI